MPDKKQAPQLMDEPPLLVYPSLAVTLGINRAIVFQQLHFLLNGQKAAKNKFNHVDGRWWVYNSYPEWRADYFPWLSISTLKGIFNGLEDELLVIARQSVKYKSDRRKWYTIDYEVWDKKCLMMGQKMSHEPSDKNCPMDGTKNVSSNGQNLSNGLSETPSDTSSKTSSENFSGAAADEHIQKIWDGARDQLQLQLDQSTFNTWLADVRMVGLEDDVLVLAVRNQFARDYCTGQLYKSVRRLVRDCAGNPALDVRFEITEAVKS